MIEMRTVPHIPQRKKALLGLVQIPKAAPFDLEEVGEGNREDVQWENGFSKAKM